MNPKDKNKVIGQGSPMKLIKGHIKGQKKKTDGRLCKQASRPRQANEQQADFGHT